MMTRDNSFIRCSLDGGKTQTDRASHRRVLWGPAGTEEPEWERINGSTSASNFK